MGNLILIPMLIGIIYLTVIIGILYLIYHGASLNLCFPSEVYISYLYATTIVLPPAGDQSYASSAPAIY